MAAVGDAVSPGKAVVVIEPMKIACPVELDISGTVSAVHVAAGALVKEGDLLAVVPEAERPIATGGLASSIRGEAQRPPQAAAGDDPQNLGRAAPDRERR